MVRSFVLAFALVVPAAPVLAETCPRPPDIAAEMDNLIAAIRAAPDAAAAQPISNRMWALWLAAPDTQAQSLLDQGMLRRQVRDFDAAVAAFDDLVEYCPDYAEGYNQRAFVHFLRGQYGPALEDLDRALARSPRHVGALSGKALTLFGLGRMDAGQAVLREALELNPWIPERSYLIEVPGEEL